MFFRNKNFLEIKIFKIFFFLFIDNVTCAVGTCSYFAYISSCLYVIL